MHRAKKKLIILAAGAVVAAAFGVPAAAQAATTASVSPSVTPGDCFQNFLLVDNSDWWIDELNTTNSEIYFGGGSTHGLALCESLVATGSKNVVIYDTSTGYCLAYNADKKYVYQHVPTGCEPTGTPATYVEWQFKSEAPNVYGDKTYEVISQYNGECLKGANPATLAPCGQSDEIYNLGNP